MRRTDAEPAVYAPRSVVIANPHAIGDVLMMLPLAGALRRKWPQVRLHFAGRLYTRPLVQACEFFDGLIDSESIIADPGVLKRIGADVFINPFSDEHLARAAFKARVPIRVGNLLRRGAPYCNRFVAYRSTRHDHMLTFAMRHAQVLGLDAADLSADHRQLFGLSRIGAPPETLGQQLDPGRFNLILHPKSGGSGREWPLPYYLELAGTLAGMNAFKLFLTGSPGEREVVERECPELLRGSLATDLMGKLSMEDLLTFVKAADGVLACSTGPLHIAAALGRHALGIYATSPGLDPIAWRPLGGPLARALSAPGRCRQGFGQCPRNAGPPCNCTRALQPQDVMSGLVLPALDAHRRAAAAAGG